MKHGGVRFLEELGSEFDRLAEPPARSRKRVGSRPAAIAVLAALALTGGAVATVVGTGDHADTTGLFDAGNRVAIAEGKTRAGHPWLLTTGTMERRGGGESFCLSLRITGTRGPEASVFCAPGFAGTYTGKPAEDAPPDSGVFFGTTPDEAASVAITASGATTEYETLDDDAGIPGRFYVADMEGDFRQAWIVFRDESGRPIHGPKTVWEFVREGK